jgi:hypothetical protein
MCVPVPKGIYRYVCCIRYTVGQPVQRESDVCTLTGVCVLDLTKY